MEVSSTLEYTEAGLSARDIFFAASYDVHFFVEDSDKENLYETIFSRLFKGVGAFKVFPLGGKTAVIQHASTSSHVSSVRRIYVLDKDFDDLHSRKVDDPKIFYLDDYCVETSIIDEESLVQFAVEEAPTVRREEIRSRLNYSGILSNALTSLDALHRAFFLVQKHNIEMRNCNCSVYEFCETGRLWCIDNAKVSAYRLRVARRLVSINVIASEDEFEDLARLAFGTGRVYRSHVNGKYLQDIFVEVLRSAGLVRGAVRRESLTIRLARTSRLSRMRRFRMRVREYLEAEAEPA